MPVAIYARKSTQGEDRQVQSLEDQIRALRSLARREGLPEPVVYQESRSAKEPGTRPEFARLMGEVAAGRIEGVLTWSISRLARNPVDGGLAAHLLQTGRLGYIRTPERVYRPEDNAILLSIENGMATAYLQDLSRAVTRGMRGKAERGWKPNKAPLGYRNDLESREIVPDEARWDAVRRIWDLALAGVSVNEIHRRAVAGGLNTRSRHRTTPPVSRARVQDLLGEPFYMGVLLYKGERLAGRHAPMVTEAEFRTVQELTGRVVPTRSAVPRFALARTMRCAACGCAVVGERRVKRYPRTGRLAEYVYYHCSGSKGCPKRGVREEVLAAQIAPVLLAARMPDSLGGWLRGALVEAVERSGVDGARDAAALEREVRAGERRLAELTRMRLDGELSPGEYARYKDGVEAGLAGSRGALERARGAAERALRRAGEIIGACELAGRGLSGDAPDVAAMGRVLRAAGGHLLTLEGLDFRPDPTIAKIAAFEPLRDGSPRPERGDRIPLDSVWWTIVDDLLATPTDRFATRRQAALLTPAL